MTQNLKMLNPMTPKNFTDDQTRRTGAWLENGRAHFRIWAPKAERAEILAGDRSFPLEKLDRGYFETSTPDLKEGDRYFVQIDGKTKVPDPASRYQPEGPHGPSEIVGRDYKWSDSNWKGVPFREWVIYELHVGTFTPEGTFDAVAKKLEYLKSTGVNVIEIMPVAQFAGRRNWGYDGVGLFATQNSYGGPVALKRLVDECHRHGLAVILDVVYNHMGPEGNYLSLFGPYFQNKYKTPWGEALNYDGEWSDEVRRYFLENARQWLEEFHFDGLRLDAVHAIFDTSARPFLEDLSRMKTELEAKTGRPLRLIAESDANDSRILRAPSEGGLGMDGQWADDLHHNVHALITGEKHGYYSDYGSVEQLAKIYQNGVIFRGEYSEFRHRSYGRPYSEIERSRLVVCSQNHDQIGNRGFGERLITLTDANKARLAAACVLLSPGLPLLYMGEEYGEMNPFLYFIDHTDKDLVEAVRKGRREEFSFFHGDTEVPDPASEDTFNQSKLNWALAESANGKAMRDYYRRLIELSKWIRREGLFEKGHVETQVLANGRVLTVRGKNASHEIQAFFSFSSEVEKVPAWGSGSKLEIALNSAEDKVFPAGKDGAGSSSFENTIELKPDSVVVYSTEARLSQSKLRSSEMTAGHLDKSPEV